MHYFVIAKSENWVADEIIKIIRISGEILLNNLLLKIFVSY